jgi:hypothetical protein
MGKDMNDDYAVFYYVADGIEQLTVWMSKEKAIGYKNDDNYFNEYEKIVLKFVK